MKLTLKKLQEQIEILNNRITQLENKTFMESFEITDKSLIHLNIDVGSLSYDHAVKHMQDVLSTCKKDYPNNKIWITARHNTDIKVTSE